MAYFFLELNILGELLSKKSRKNPGNNSVKKIQKKSGKMQENILQKILKKITKIFFIKIFFKNF